ncbi:hypothetical protein IAT38_002566 [Cryptococcus sp. DSM 104549]
MRFGTILLAALPLFTSVFSSPTLTKDELALAEHLEAREVDLAARDLEYSAIAKRDEDLLSAANTLHDAVSSATSNVNGKNKDQVVTAFKSIISALDTFKGTVNSIPAVTARDEIARGSHGHQEVGGVLANVIILINSLIWTVIISGVGLIPVVYLYIKKIAEVLVVILKLVEIKLGGVLLVIAKILLDAGIVLVSVLGGVFNLLTVLVGGGLKKW